MSHNTILLVEDEENDALSLQSSFRQWRVTNPLRIATSGEQALAYLNGGGDYWDRTQYPLPSLILLDLGLPQLSGFQVLSWIRARAELKRVPVVVLSGSENRRDIDQAYELGANSYLIKTPDHEKLRYEIIDLNRFVLTLVNPDSIIHFAPPLAPGQPGALPAFPEETSV